MKIILAFLCVIVLLYGWNKLTCQFCPDAIPGAGSAGPFHFASDIGTMKECAIHGENSPITRRYVMVSWQVNIYIPFLGCFANDPTPLYFHLGPINVTIGGWFKGWHRVPMLRMGL